MEEKKNLKDMMDDFEMNIYIFTDFCEFIQYTNYRIKPDEYQEKYLGSVLYVLAEYAREIKKKTDELFNDKRMIEFYYSEKAKEIGV